MKLFQIVFSSYLLNKTAKYPLLKRYFTFPAFYVRLKMIADRVSVSSHGTSTTSDIINRFWLQYYCSCDTYAVHVATRATQ